MTYTNKAVFYIREGTERLFVNIKALDEKGEVIPYLECDQPAEQHQINKYPVEYKAYQDSIRLESKA